MSEIKVISCDVHGTLILPEPSVGEIYASYARPYYPKVNSQALDDAFIPAFQRVRKSWPIDYGANQDDAQLFWTGVIRACFFDAQGIIIEDALAAELFHGFGKGAHWRILSAVQDCLDYVATSEVPLCICSNFDQRVRGILEDLNLAKHVDHWFISAELGLVKPDPQLMHKIAEHYQCEPHEILHIGNHLREDGEFCQKSGAQFYYVDERANKPMLLSTLQSFF